MNNPTLNSVLCVLCPLALLLLPSQATLAQMTTWRGGHCNYVAKKDLELAGGIHGFATLDSHQTPLKVGEQASFEYRFFNKGIACRYYNPFLNLGVQPPAALAIYDSNTNYIGNFFRTHNAVIARHGLNPEDWATEIPHEANVGATIHVAFSDLAPGDYQVQLVFGGLFMLGTSGSPTKDQEQEGLFRSNPVRITITK